MKSFKWISCSSSSQLWVILANCLKSTWFRYQHINNWGQMVTRARTFESYHAKTIFIKATGYHCISSSRNPSIRKHVSEPVQILCSAKRLTELLLWAGRWGRQLPTWETGQPAALPCPERDWARHSPNSHWSRHRGRTGRRGRETGWEKEVGMGKGMRVTNAEIKNKATVRQAEEKICEVRKGAQREHCSGLS